jgi:CDGSH-type Zn-finger protein
LVVRVRAQQKPASLRFYRIQVGPTETKEAWMCGRKHTAGQPFCDKTHKRI